MNTFTNFPVNIYKSTSVDEMLSNHLKQFSYKLYGYDDNSVYFFCPCGYLQKIQFEYLLTMKKSRCCLDRDKNIKKEIDTVYKSVNRLFKYV